MQSLKFSGGGGTNFGPAFDHLREKNIRPECLVFLTDGFGMFPKEAPNYPVIWCLTSSHLENTQFPFGECLEMKDFGTD
jgi:predicted metal-dependent peptidase